MVLTNLSFHLPEKIVVSSSLSPIIYKVHDREKKGEDKNKTKDKLWLKWPFPLCVVVEKPVGQTTVTVQSDSTLVLPSRDWLQEGNSRLSIISGIFRQP
jgi:hypothetical protein